MGQFFILRSRGQQEYNGLLVNALSRIFKSNLSLNNFKWLLTKVELWCVRNIIPDSSCSFTDRLCRSILWLCTDDPTITDLASSPQANVISLHTKTFSPPWSLRIRWGLPYLRTASLKERRTVSDLLFVEQRQKVMRRLKPSIQWWITNLHLINLWLPSLKQSSVTIF